MKTLNALRPLLRLSTTGGERSPATTLLLVLVLGVAPVAASELLCAVRESACPSAVSEAVAVVGGDGSGQPETTTARCRPSPVLTMPRTRCVTTGGLPAPRAPDRR